MDDVTIAGVGDLLGALDLVGDVMIAVVEDLLSDLDLVGDVIIAGIGDLLRALDLVGDVMIAGVGDLLSDLESDLLECPCSTDDAGVMSSSKRVQILLQACSILAAVVQGM